MYVEQLSFYTTAEAATAVSIWTGKEHQAGPLEPWMREIMPNGEFVIYPGDKAQVLVPVPLRREDIRSGHEYYHYLIGGQMYAGTFVWRERDG